MGARNGAHRDETAKLAPSSPNLEDMNNMLAGIIIRLERRVDDVCDKKDDFNESAQKKITQVSEAFSLLKIQTNAYCLEHGPMFQELVDVPTLQPNAEEFGKAAEEAKGLANSWAQFATLTEQLKREIPKREKQTWKRILLGALTGAAVILLVLSCWHMLVAGTVVSFVAVASSGSGLLTSSIGLVRRLVEDYNLDKDVGKLRKLVEQIESDARTGATLTNTYSLVLGAANRTVKREGNLSQERRIALLNSFLALQSALYGPKNPQVDDDTLAMGALMLNVGAAVALVAG